jgi:hypothetical protein
MKIFRLKDYIFVPKDFLDLIKKLWTWSHFTDWMGIIILAVYFFVFGYIFDASPEPLFFIAFILAMIYWSMDSRVSIALALACLVSIPVMQVLYNKNILFQGEIWSEKVAVWAYYFLVIGVVKQIFELKKEN